MCGIFGLVRSPDDPDPQRASCVFAALGHLSEVRGPRRRRLRPGHHPRSGGREGRPAVVPGLAPPSPARGRRGPGRARPHPPRDPGRRRPSRQRRAAGRRRRPGRCGQRRHRRRRPPPPPAAGAARTPRGDRQRDRLYVARGALCPLALATDAAGNLYWASSPTWLRRVAGLEAERVPEGTLLVVAAGVRPAVVAERRFVPVARPGDDQCFPSIWEGLDSEDVAAFQAEARHLVAPGPPAVEAAA